MPYPYLPHAIRTRQQLWMTAALLIPIPVSYTHLYRHHLILCNQTFHLSHARGIGPLGITVYNLDRVMAVMGAYQSGVTEVVSQVAENYQMCIRDRSPY